MASTSGPYPPTITSQVYSREVGASRMVPVASASPRSRSRAARASPPRAAVPPAGRPSLPRSPPARTGDGPRAPEPCAPEPCAQGTRAPATTSPAAVPHRSALPPGAPAGVLSSIPCCSPCVSIRSPVLAGAHLVNALNSSRYPQEPTRLPVASVPQAVPSGRRRRSPLRGLLKEHNRALRLRGGAAPRHLGQARGDLLMFSAKPGRRAYPLPLSLATSWLWTRLPERRSVPHSPSNCERANRAAECLTRS